MAKATEKVYTGVAKSQEYVDDSTSDESSDAAPAQEASRKESAVKSKSKSKSRPEAKSDTSDDESSSSEVSSTSSASTRSGGNKRRLEAAEQVKKPVSKKHKSSSVGMSSSARNYYKPPVGYDSIQLDATDFVSETGNMFSNLDGKQVWHITAPASLPVTSIKVLDVQAALRGEPVLHHNGVSYNMFAAIPKEEVLLIPQGSNSTYTNAKVDVSRNFHLRELAHTNDSKDQKESLITDKKQHQNGDHTDVSNYHFFAHKQGINKLPRTQPTGLLLRYKPFGSGRQSQKPYKLSHPDVDGIEQVDDIVNNQLVVPQAESDGDDNDVPSRHISNSKTDKGSRKSKSKIPYRTNGIAGEDVMDIDIPSTPHSKSKLLNVQPKSEKKRKRDRKEQV